MKKILSILLAAAMLLSVCPVAFASDTATEFTGYTYKFTKDVFPENFNPSIGNLEKIAKGEEIELTGTDPWMVASNSYIAGVSSSETGLLISNTIASTNFDDKMTCSAIKLEVGTAGTYIPKLMCRARPNGPIIDVFLVKEGTESGGINTSDFDFVRGENGPGDADLLPYIKGITEGMEDIHILKKGLDLYAEKNDTTKTEYFDYKEIDLEKGNYFLIILFSGKSESVPSNKTGLSAFLNTFSLTPVEYVVAEEFTPSVDSTTPVTDSASVKMLAYYGDTSDTIGEVSNVTYGESVEIPAPAQTYTDEETGTTYTFRYWTKGLETGIANRQAISTALSFDYMPHGGSNFLIAVYEEEGNAEEAFYNYNGQLLTKLEIVDNKLPLLPAMAGFGPAQKWEQLGTGELFDANADVSNLEGDKVFMAKYGDKISNITINGNTYAYGDPVECKSTDSNFSYWARTINGVREIVSVSPTYTFRAFADCTVEAVCNGKIEVESPCKILLSTFTVGDMTAVMAEFIGFEGAKEKGIMFGETQKIAMTTNKTQFTVTNDTEDDVEVKGYAVVDGNRLVGDSITVAGTASAE